MPPRACLVLEILETRALPSSVPSFPLLETVNSTNWSGYAAETNLSSPAANAVTMVSGSWKVPTVTGKTNAYSSVWVGMDGYSSSSVEQLGTEQDTSKTGATRYYAWWEMYPHPLVRISGMTISPGDSMSASVTYSGGAFTLRMTDNTTGQSFSTTQSATAQRSSAEWIVEAPSSISGVLPLANFGTATFAKAQATINGVSGAIDNTSWQHTAINMVTTSGSPLDQTSGLTDTTTQPITSSFTVAYTGSGGGGGGHGHGHGPHQTLGQLVAPLQANFLAAAHAEVASMAVADEAVSHAPDASPATPTGLDQFASAPVADTLFTNLLKSGSMAGLKPWGSAWQAVITDDALGSDTLASDGLDAGL
jgi:hypothetical protein